MIKGSIERLFEFANARNDARFEQRIEIAEALCFLLQVIEEAQGLHVFVGERRNVSVGENLEQRDFERRKWQSAVEAVSAALPLARDARMAIQKSRDQISLVAMKLGGLTIPSKVTEHRLSDLRVSIRCEGPPQHGWRDGHVEQAQPAMHGRQGLLHAVVALQRD